MDIYWIKDKRQCGPATVPDVISLLQTEELSPDTLGWHAGCQKWLPLRELPALADFLNKETAAVEDEPTSEQPACGEECPGNTKDPHPMAPATRPDSPPPAAPELSAPAAQDIPQDYAARRIYLPSPTARLLARFVDYALYTVAFYGVIYLRQIPFDAALLLSVNPLLWLPMVVIEAVLLSTWGTTPGKALMGIRLTTFGDAPRLNFLRTFMRSLMVFTLGMGVMMPQLLPIMLAFEYWMLRRRGITPWDARCSTLPTQQAPALPSRYVLAIVTLYIGAVVTASCVQPWFRHMIAEIEKETPELAQTLRQYLPEEQATANEQPAPPAATQDATPAPAVPAPQDTSLPGI